MSVRPLLYTLTLSFVSILCLSVGAIGVIVPWSKPLQQAVIRFLTNNWLFFFPVGIALLTLSIALFALVVARLRSRFFTFKSNETVVTIDEKVLKAYVSEYWRKRFPSSPCASDVRIKNRRLVISAHLPFVSPVHQDTLLNEAKEELEELFISSFGCHYPLHLCISFGD